MPYPQKLLSDGEEIEFEMRPHWRALVVPGLLLLIVVFGGVYLIAKFDDWFANSPIPRSLGSWGVALIGLFVLIVFVVRPFLYWVTTQYVFTNRRIIVRAGLVARHGRDMPLSKVNNVSFDISVFGRMLNYGMLTIDSASDEALVIVDVPNVERIQREVNRLHEEDDEHRRRSLFADPRATPATPSAPPPPPPPPGGPGSETGT